ncbi:MAG: Histidine kinase protein, partial [Patescibacteria group bacterium]|nr:Histidine kinase protein [Patescibacteria group bacterium]
MNDNHNELSVIKRQKIQNFLKRNIYLVVALVLAVLLLFIVIAFQIMQRDKLTSKAVTNTAEFEPDNHTIKTDNVVAEVADQESIIEWKQSVNPSESLQDLPIDGVIYEKIDENQEFQNDSLELPDGWTGQWTAATPTNGQTEKDLTYQDFPVSGISPVTYLKITTGISDTLKPNVQSSIIEPVNITALDRTGYTPSSPVLYNKKIYQVMMAVNVTTDPSKYTIDCYDLETYAKCDGYPSYMSSVNNSDLGTGTKDIRTAMNMQIILDDGQFGNEGRMYVPAQQGNNYGVACVDLKLKKNCGFTTMGTSTAPTGTINPALVSGFVRSGDRFYGHANDADRTNQTVVCFDMDLDGLGTDGLCPDFTATTNAAVQTYDISKHNGSYQTFNLPIMSGTKLFWIVAYRHTATDIDVDIFEAGNPSLREQSDRGNVLTCFDTATMLPCAGPGNNSGWSHFFGGITSEADGIGSENVKAYATFIWKKPGNVDHGICKLSGFGNGVDPSMVCYYLDSGLMLPNVTGERSPPSFLPLQWLSVPWTFGPNVNTIVDSQGNNRSYFPIYTTYYPALDAVSPYLAKLKGATLCYDWDTQELCNDFAGGRIRYWHEINDGDSATVGYLYDGQCMWAAGYYGDLWSFDPDNGLIPCRTSKTKLNITATGKKFYCDGVARAFNWDRVRLSKSNMYDYEKFDIKITDGNGNIIDQGNIRETGFLNISTGYNNSNNPDNDTNGYKNLELEVNPKVLNTSPWANGSKPQISAILDAEPVQYCYKTKVKSYCDINSVSAYSKAELTTETDIVGTNLTTNVPVDQAPEVQCFRDLKPTVTPNKSLVSNDELITYSIDVQNKANKDILNGRGDIPNVNNPETATLEATIPSGMTFVSADNGGLQQGNKVVWSNQSYPAAETTSYSVILQAPSSAVGMFEGAPQKGKVYAATTQTPLTMQATVIYGEDYFPSDNTAANTSAVFANTTIPPNVVPIVSTTVSNTNATAPASFTVDAQASDSDGYITKIEIFLNGEIAKTCLSTQNCS